MEVKKQPNSTIFGSKLIEPVSKAPSAGPFCFSEKQIEVINQMIQNAMNDVCIVFLVVFSLLVFLVSYLR
jgi:hypothetical protein